MAALGCSFLAETIDRHIAQDYTAWYLFRGGPEGARSVLSVIAQSVLTFSGIVFSVTVLVLQLASNQFSPRVLKTFLRDRASQGVFGIFVGTFLYALVGLRSVRGTADVSEYVPSFTVWIAVLLAMVCVAAFIFYVHHIAQSIRAVEIIRRIGRHTRRAIEHLFPEGVGDDACDRAGVAPASPPSAEIPFRGEDGVLQKVELERLMSLARDAGVVLALVPRIGDYLACGSAAFRVFGDPARLDVAAVEDTLVIGRERTHAQDPAFGLRQLVDIAERALSPAVNDPSTAVQALDEVHSILRRLVTRRFPAVSRLDDEGRLRLIVGRPSFTEHLHLSFDEIVHYGARSIQVARRVRAILDDLLGIAPAFRRQDIAQTIASLPWSNRPCEEQAPPPVH